MFKSKKFFRTKFIGAWLLILLLIMSWALTSCSSSGGSYYPGKGVAPQDPDREIGLNNKYAPTGAPNPDTENPDKPNQPVDRKIIRNAHYQMRSTDLDATVGGLRRLINELDGYETNFSSRTSDERRYINIEFKVPAEKLQDFIDKVGDFARVTHSTVKSDDITDQYYDYTIRLRTLETSLEKYYDLLKDVKDVDSIIALQSRIDYLTTEIESFKGTIRRWDSQVAYSTISIELQEEDDPTLLKREVDWNTLSWDDVKYLAASGFKSVAAWLVRFFQWLGITLVAALPIWLPALIIIIILVRLRRRYRIKKGLPPKRERKKRGARIARVEPRPETVVVQPEQPMPELTEPDVVETEGDGGVVAPEQQSDE